VVIGFAGVGETGVGVKSIGAVVAIVDGMLESLGGDTGTLETIGHGDEAFGFASIHGGVDDAELAVFAAKILSIVSFCFWDYHIADYMEEITICKGGEK